MMTGCCIWTFNVPKGSYIQGLVPRQWLCWEAVTLLGDRASRLETVVGGGGSSSRTVLAPWPFLPLSLCLSSVNRSAFSATCSHHDAHGPQAARSSRQALKPQPKQMLAPEPIISGVGHGRRKPRHCLSSIFRPRVFLGLYIEDINSKASCGDILSLRTITGLPLLCHP